MKMKFTIRFTEGMQDLDIEMDENISVRYLKLKIKEQVPDLEHKFIKLIKGGALLSDNQLISQSLSEADKKRPKIFIHCSTSEISTEETQESTTVEREVLGFDRLRDTGISEQEIEDIRRNFHLAHGTDDGTFNLERMREIEESWMDNTSNEEIPESNLRNANYHATFGLIVGFFGGFIPLFFFRNNTRIFNIHTMLGIFGGIMVNLTYGFVRWIST